DVDPLGHIDHRPEHAGVGPAERRSGHRVAAEQRPGPTGDRDDRSPDPFGRTSVLAAERLGQRRRRARRLHPVERPGVQGSDVPSLGLLGESVRRVASVGRQPPDSLVAFPISRRRIGRHAEHHHVADRRHRGRELHLSQQPRRLQPGQRSVERWADHQRRLVGQHGVLGAAERDGEDPGCADRQEHGVRSVNGVSESARLATALSGGEEEMLIRVREERGAAMILALLVTVVVLALSIVIVNLAIHSSTSSAYDRRRTIAVAAAEAGVDDYYRYLADFRTVSSGTTLTSIDCARTGSVTTGPNQGQWTSTLTLYSYSGGTYTPMSCPPLANVVPAGARITSVGRSPSNSLLRRMESFVRISPVYGGFNAAMLATTPTTIGNKVTINGL